MTVDQSRADLIRIIPVVIGIGLTSIIGWGTSFSAIAILGSIIGRDLAISREAIFGGIAIMLVVSGLVAPRAGQLVDRQGPRRIMAFGSVLAAVSLALMAKSTGMMSYWAAWALFGIAVPLALSNAAMTAMAQVGGPHARRAITGLTIMAGITSALFLPITAWLEARYGWRSTLAIFALLHLALCLPIHLAVLPKQIINAPTGASGAASDASWDGILPDAMRRRAFWLIVLWSCFEGMLVWGFNMQAVDLLRGLGLAPEAAIAVWMLSGPSQSAARIGEFMLAGRLPIIMTAIASAALAPLGFLIFWFAGADARAASLMAVCYGLGHGLFAIARNVLPLRLFGMKTFGETMGRLALPQNIANAFAPILFAFVLSRYGSVVALWFAVFCATASLISVMLLARALKRP